jgi:hypothetical protein
MLGKQRRNKSMGMNQESLILPLDGRWQGLLPRAAIFAYHTFITV